MSHEEIIAMATEAGLNSYRIAPGEALAVWERFAALVEAKERKACAHLVASRSRGIFDMGEECRQTIRELSTAIRARGKP